MRKTSLLLWSALLSASFMFSNVAPAAAADLSSTNSTTFAPLVRQSSNVDVESSQIARLSRDEFYARYAELTEKSINQVRSEFSKSEQNTPKLFAGDPYETFDAEYSSNVDIGAGVKVKVGVLVQVEQFRFGNSYGHRFKKVYDDTGYIAPYSGSFTVVKNFAKGSIQASGSLQLSYSGYAEAKVDTTTSKSMELDLSLYERVQVGWSFSETKSGTDYYRKHFNGSNTVAKP
ncbi:hypothetical protein [Paenibacillus alvei]|uniref:hypothetical protein n=1 Tax=Paenibacillus alvei TaxID=44250 RepID=UPI001F508031|nr:hypothetical protein [Paenibacillus alvei]MCY9578812.1 hypothetical protein [Paenibacillus alvei]MCY9583868.1 hypothetical protein [Paenibacillus alvei]